MAQKRSDQGTGVALGLGAYFLWGILPLYFKLVGQVPAVEIVADRVIWSVLFLAGLVTLRRRWSAIRTALSTGRVLLILIATAGLIAANWLIYIWAIVNGHILAASLGYYLNPLVNVLLGVIILKEKLTRGQLAAVLLAAVGVAVLAFGAGASLWISLSLALSFGLYGFVRKVTPVDFLEGLAIETAILAPLSLGYLLWAHPEFSGLAAYDMTTNVLLIVGGALTAIPLLLFNAAAKRLPYSTLGFLQYLAPTLQFLIAVAVYGEVLTIAHMVCFAAIWTALAIFAGEGLRVGRARARAAEACAEPCP